MTHPTPNARGPRRRLPAIPTSEPPPPGVALDVADYLDAQGHLRAPSRIPAGLDLSQAPEDLAGLLKELSVAEELKAQSQAAASRKSYGWHVRKYADWCQARGVVALPATPTTVATHLAAYSVSRDDAGAAARDGDGHLIANVTPASVAIRLAAINKLHRLAGFGQPGDDPEVSQTLAGIRRTFGVAARNAKAAIDHDALRALLTQAEAPRYVPVRDACLILLRRAKMTAGQAARLHWGDIDIQADRVQVVVRGDARGGHDKTLVLASDNPRWTPPGMDVSALFAALMQANPADALRSTFVNPSKPDRPLTRQAIEAVLNAVLPQGNGYIALSELTPAAYRDVFLRAFPGLNGVQGMRDTALLTTGWFLALRRSNLSALAWGDLAFSPQGIRVVLRRSKTDQAGLGVTHWLSEPQTALPPDVVSPTGALRRWHDWARAHLGTDPTSDPRYARQPVFPALTRADLPKVNRRTGLWTAFSGPDMNAMVQGYAGDARLSPEWPMPGERHAFGAHSLRAGFVTEALRGDKLTIPEVADITGHKDPRTLLAYRREVNQVADNPVSRLVARLGED